MWAQVSFSQEIPTKDIDSLYKEDQFYAGITYNLIGSKPIGLSQNGFSFGFHFGFIKDMPINKKRNLALGIGLGYSANSFNQNLLVNKDNVGEINYSILEDATTYTKNKFSEHLVEVPFEFRWRDSSPTEYNFWRIYTGFKIGYVFASKTKYIGDLGNLKYSGISDFNEIQYGLTLAIGYNTWNFYVYYALNPLFKSNAKLEGQSIDMKAIKIGLMFYVL
tara:strand:- start:12032 stop:12691 length:660 start_codon:yes stop_codon:yes gene_type:complete